MDKVIKMYVYKIVIAVLNDNIEYRAVQFEQI